MNQRDIDAMLKDEGLDLYIRLAQKALMDLYDEGKSIRWALEPHGLRDLDAMYDWCITVAVPSILEVWEAKGGTSMGYGGHAACVALGIAIGTMIADDKVSLDS